LKKEYFGSILEKKMQLLHPHVKAKELCGIGFSIEFEDKACSIQ